MNKYKQCLEDYIKMILEEINKISLEDNDDFTRGQRLAYYNVIKILEYKIFSQGLGLNRINRYSLLNINKNSESFHTIKKIINEWDPYDLLSIGAPHDEYEMEIEEIIFRIKDKNNIEDNAAIISDVFSNSFNDYTFFTVENCIDIAKKIKME